MATITNLEAQTAAQALGELASQRVPFALALKMRRVSRALRERLADVEAERMKLIEEHGKRDAAGELVRENVSADGQHWTHPMEDGAAFATDYQALMAETFACEGFSVEELEALGEVTARQLEALGGLLIEDPDGGEGEGE